VTAAIALVAAGRLVAQAAAPLVAVGTVVGIVSGARTHRARARLRDRCAGPGARPAPAPSVRSGAVVLVVDAWRAAAVAVGSRVLRLAGRSPAVDTSRRIGGALLLATMAVASGCGPVVALVVGLAAWATPLTRALSRRSRERAALVDELPEIVDLVRLGVGSGLNVRLALEAVVRHHDGRIVAELRDVLARAGRGERLADALDRIDPASDAVAPLVDALVATERYGAPLVTALDRVAADARLARRRRREEVARRVPVKLLFPLVFCTLPAFALLTVVPVLVRSLPSLSP
jgi:hypothetical protein